jgi:hypothetical protein
MALPTSLQSGLVATVVGYLALVKLLRWRRYNDIHAKYTDKFASGIPFTPEEAQAVLRVSAFYDMPFLLYYALSFALFKTYAIVSDYQ